ncbi:MAG: apolipoprotein N-acyltransferase [Methyloligellaceae bacterium]
MQAISDFIADLSGWKQWFIALLAGAAATLSLAPNLFWISLFVSVPILIWMLDGIWLRSMSGKSGRNTLSNAFIVGWWFGFGYFFVGLRWIGEAFLVDADLFAWLMPFAMALLPAGLALFFGVATACIIRFWRPGISRILLLAWALFATELLRGHIFTGLPWNTLGYSLTGTDGLMQSTSVVGVYVLTYVAVLVFSVPAALVFPQNSNNRIAANWSFAIAVLLLVISLDIAGQWRLTDKKSGTQSNIRLHLVQPNINQKEKWRPENQKEIVDRIIGLSKLAETGTSAGSIPKNIIIWPEVALPFLFDKNAEFLNFLGDSIPDETVLITGAIRTGNGDPGRQDGRPREIYNSLMVIDSDGQIEKVYDKKHLVPFGEYLPFQNFLEAIGLQQLTRLRGGFTEGRGERYIQANSLPAFAPLICYEIIFSGAVVEVTNRPEWLLNLTNDGWFGDTAGPHQHLHQARIRAIEEGLPVVRVANTGISVVIDSYGQILERIPLNQMGTIDSGLPLPLEETVYARHGLPIIFVLLILGFLFPVILQARSGDDLKSVSDT